VQQKLTLLVYGLYEGMIGSSFARWLLRSVQAQ